MAYKVIHDYFHNDPDIRALSGDAERFLFYAITCKHSHFCGIYLLPKGYITSDKGWSTAFINRCISELSKPQIGLSIGLSIDQSIGLSNALSKPKFFLKYDNHSQIIWVRTMLKHQISHRKLNSKQLKAVSNHMVNLPMSPLLHEMSAYYSELNLPFFDQKLLPYHTVSVSEAEYTSETETVSNITAPVEKVRHLEFVFLTEEENKKLKQLLNGKHDDYIQRLNDYIGQIGTKAAAKKYRSHFHTLKNWYAKDLEKPKPKGSEYL